MRKEARAADLARFLSRLREVIDEQGWTQSQLAERLGVSDATVSDWFRRGRSPLSEVVLRMPEALNVNGHWLLTGRGPRELPTSSSNPSARDVRSALGEISECVERLQRQWAED